MDDCRMNRLRLDKIMGTTGREVFLAKGPVSLISFAAVRHSAGQEALNPMAP